MSKLILVSGPPGVGKSRLSRALVERLDNTILIDKDLIDEAFSPEDRGEEYTLSIEPKVLQAMLNLAQENLACGRSVLLDAPWTHIIIQEPLWKKKILSLTLTLGVALKVVELYLDEGDLFERIKKRGLKRDSSKLSSEGWIKFKKRDHIFARIALEHLALDSSLSFKKNLLAASNYILG